MRLAVALGFTVDPEYFESDAGWTLVAKLESMMNSQARLDPVVLRLLEDLSIALNARGRDEAVFHQVLEGQLGSSPFPPETIIGIVKYVRAQLHFDTKPTRVELDPKSATHVPNKNYEFK